MAQTTPFLQTEFSIQFWEGAISLVFCLMGISIYSLYKKQQKLLQEQAKYKMLALNQETLVYQMDQHFAFNTLNSIQRLILENETPIAMHYIAQFGKLIRSTLQQSKNNHLTIEEEISNLELYLQMELLRTKKGFTYSISVGKEVDSYNIEVPTGLIQPLVEHAIWQGIIPAGKKGGIRIAFQCQSKYLICEIEDDGVVHSPFLFSERKAKQSPLSHSLLLLKQRIATLNLGSNSPIKLTYISPTHNRVVQKNLILIKIPILRYQ